MDDADAIHGGRRRRRHPAGDADRPASPVGGGDDEAQSGWRFVRGNPRPEDEGRESGGAKSKKPAPPRFPRGWLQMRDPSLGDAYGVVAKPLLLTTPGPAFRGRLRGGWRGRRVMMELGADRVPAALWRVPERGEPLDALKCGSLSDADDSPPHAWFYPVGPAWYLGRVHLPPELLVFLGETCREEIRDATEEAPVLLRHVLAQFMSAARPGVFPATLMEVDPTGLEEVETTVQLYEAALQQRRSVGGISVNCTCDRPGRLQCLSFCNIIEELIREALGGPYMSRVQFECALDDVSVLRTWAVSGPGFHWHSRYIKVGDAGDETSRNYVTNVYL